MTAPRVDGTTLPRRVSLPTISMLEEHRRFWLDEDGTWSVEDYYEGVSTNRDAARPGDTGETTEWIITPSWSKGIPMSVDLPRGFSARVSTENDHGDTLTVRIYDADETLVSFQSYTGCILLVRELAGRPLESNRAFEDVTRGLL